MPADALPGVPRPRDRHVLLGQEEGARALAEADRSGRLHHAWLIGGPEGIGKATLAYRFARFLLAPPSERLAGGDGLGVDPEGRTARQITAGSHPNLLVLERASPDGDKAAPKTVSVDAARKVLTFFNATAADGGRRICIIDTIDDLTPAATNALLKTVEEPPARALVLICSHAPRRVLPTIRSRCRRLALPTLPDETVAEVLRTLGGPTAGLDDARLLRAAASSGGSVARALDLLDGKRIALIDELTGLLDALPQASPRRVLALADRLGDRRGEADFALAVETVQLWLERRVHEGRHLGPARLAPLAEVCENVGEAARSVETYNLDRRAFIVTTFGDLAEAVRRAA